MQFGAFMIATLEDGSWAIFIGGEYGTRFFYKKW